MTDAHLRALRFAGRLRSRGHAVKGDALAAEWRAVDKAKQAAEARMAERVRAVLADAVERAAARMGRMTVPARAPVMAAEASSQTKRAGGDEPLAVLTSAAFDLAALFDEIAPLFAAEVVAAVRAGFATGAVRLEATALRFDADRPAVRAVVAALLEKAQSVPETLRSRVDTIVRDGVGRNLSGSEIAALIREAAPDMTQNQAETVASTTGAGSFEAGQQVSFSEAGVERKRWLAVRDGNTRDAHAETDGQEVALDEPFDVGGYAAMHPCDPALPVSLSARCRCTTLPVIGTPAADGGETKASASGARAWRLERDAAIRKSYPALRDRHGAQVAVSRLAEEHAVSERTIERAVWGR